MNTSIWTSRKLWVGIADAVISIVTLVLTAYLAPDNVKFALGIIAALQPVVYAIIAGLTTEEAARIAAEATKSVALANLESVRLAAKK